MSWTYAQAYSDLGPARGPRLGITWHMAEGGGTVAYLAKPNPNGVSVHFVVEYDGDVVQMLPLDHMQSSIRTTAIRTSDDPPYSWADADVTYGRTAAAAVLGLWADVERSLGPNHATIGVEVEGFAADGPNPAQVEAMAGLYAELERRYPGIRSLGHRDFADYKACPGRRIPWQRLGGHGSQEGIMSIYAQKPVTGNAALPAGAVVRAFKPTATGWVVDKVWKDHGASSVSFVARLSRISGTDVPSTLLKCAAGGFFDGLYVSTAEVAEVLADPPDVDTLIAAAVEAQKATDAELLTSMTKERDDLRRQLTDCATKAGNAVVEAKAAQGALVTFIAKFGG